MPVAGVVWALMVSAVVRVHVRWLHDCRKRLWCGSLVWVCEQFEASSSRAHAVAVAHGRCASRCAGSVDGDRLCAGWTRELLIVPTWPGCGCALECVVVWVGAGRGKRQWRGAGRGADAGIGDLVMTWHVQLRVGPRSACVTRLACRVRRRESPCSLSSRPGSTSRRLATK